MPYFLCPVCGEKLTENERNAVCPKNHSFDKAKSGYINLLPNNLRGGNHGDNKLMINARHAFLEKGYYLPLRNKLCEVLKGIADENSVLLDLGCGEGWYTNGFADAMQSADILALDISKDALKFAAKRNKRIKCAAASVFHLPIAENSVDVGISVFSPLCEEEFNRVIKSGGYFVYVIPAENHLWSLKKAIYEKPYKNEVKSYTMSGFDFEGKEIVRGNMNFENTEDVENLFKMTPYYYKTSADDQKRLLSKPPRDIEYDFEILIFKKQQIISKSEISFRLNDE